jgi:uncharacterized membrane protein (UPF0127 family)
MLNKTPAVNEKKIKLAHSRKQLIADLLGFYWLVVPVLVTFVVAMVYMWGHHGGCSGVQLSQECYVAEYASTEAARAKGLSGRESLPERHVMVFVFERSNRECFWMKDMQFAIDMVFLDSNKTVKRIDKNVLPDTYPDSFCADDTRYVLELNAGVSERIGLRIGDKIAF